jgi:MFS family permease
MSRPSSAILPLLVGVALLTAANALLGTLVSVRMAIEGFPPAMSGLVMSAYYAGFVLGSLYGSRVIDRVGHIRAFAACAAMLGVAATLQPLAVEPLVWILLRGLVGFAIAGELMVAESWMNAEATSANRAQTFSRYVMTASLAFGSGQFLLALGDPSEPELFLLVALLMSGSILPIVLTQGAVPSTPPSPPVRIRPLFDRAPLGLAGALAAGIAVGGIQAIGPQFAGGLGLPIGQISQFMGAFFLSGMLLQWPVGRLSDRRDRRQVLAIMSVIGSVLCIGIALVGDASRPGLLVLAVCGGSVLATIYPLSVAHANDRMQGAHVVVTAATMLLTYGSGAALGPILATTVMAVVGPEGLFYVAATPLAGLSVYAMYRVVAYARVEQTRFESAAETTPAALELDPRVSRGR